MSEFKGTKGKWYRNTESRIVSCVYSENKESLIHISGKNNEEAKANALLISKAPDMLDLFIQLRDTEDFGIAEIEQITELIKQATEL